MIKTSEEIELEEKETAILDGILEKEKSHFQWLKHSFCLIVLASQLTVNLIRSKEFQIVVGLPFDKCTWYDISMWVMYFGACFTITIVAIKRNNFEQNLKIKYNKGICKSDLRFAPSIVRRLVVVGFLGGWVSGALGLGGGAIFNPVLLSMGIPASVSGSTGMYLVMFTTLGQSVTYILIGQLNF